LFVQEAGESVATGKLLFRPNGKLKITHPDLAMTYKEGADYVWNPERDRIELTISSRIPFKTEAQIKPPAGSPNTLRGVLWSEGHFFHDLQVQVTYEHEDSFPWRPAPSVNTLGRSLASRNGKHVPSGRYVGLLRGSRCAIAKLPARGRATRLEGARMLL
jgi:hypothetical protein